MNPVAGWPGLQGLLSIGTGGCVSQWRHDNPQALHKSSPPVWTASRDSFHRAARKACVSQDPASGPRVSMAKCPTPTGGQCRPQTGRRGCPHQALRPRNRSEGRECVDVGCPQTRPLTKPLLPAAGAVALTHPEDMVAELANAGEGLCLLTPCCPWPGHAWGLQGRTWSLSLWEPLHS